jgi:tetratricopeptide (TPR) repeat protein
VFVDAAAWQALDRDHQFDYVVLQRNQNPGDRLLDYLDADSTWSLVFSDDVAQIMVRNDGKLRSLAEQFGYRVLPAGVRRRESLMAQVQSDSLLRLRAVAELRRMAEASRHNGSALYMLATLRMQDGAWDEAADHLHAVLAVDPERSRAREQLGVIELVRGHPADALRWFERERALGRDLPGVDTRIGQAREALGDVKAARRAYERELRRHPDFTPARAALERLGGQ